MASHSSSNRMILDTLAIHRYNYYLNSSAKVVPNHSFLKQHKKNEKVRDMKKSNIV